MALRRRLKNGRRRCRTFPICRLPEDVLLEILNKMNTNLLIEMRQTCSSVDSVIERLGRKFASRPVFGIALNLMNETGYYSGKDKEETSTVYFTKGCYVENKENIVVKGDFERKITGISFRHIYLGIENRDREAYLRILKIFEKCQPVCKYFLIYYCPLDLVIPITNCLTITAEYDAISICGFDDDFNLESAENLLSSYKQSRNCSKTKIYLPDHTKITEKIFEKVNVFAKASLSTDINGFHELLWDIHNSKKKIRMSLLQIYLVNPNSVFDCQSLPPIHNIRPPLGSEKHHQPTVRVMSTSSQFVIIKELGRYNKNDESQQQEMTFIEKSALALEKCFLLLFADNHMYKEFHGVDDDDDNLYEDTYEYYEDDGNDDEEDELVEPRLQYKIIRRGIRSIVKSIMQ